jgi:hypothetical protein
MVENNLLVECLVCGEKMKAIKHLHLKKHGMTHKEYLLKFPGAQMESKAHHVITHSNKTVAQKELSKTEEAAKRLTDAAINKEVKDQEAASKEIPPLVQAPTPNIL